MAVFTGTATSHIDLLNKIVGHLTDAGSMGSQVWQLLLSRTVAGNATTQGNMQERYLKGPGLAGADAIYVNLRSYDNPSSDYYNWEIRGAINHNPLLPFETQPGTSPDVHKQLWNSSIPYTLIANGRRFIVNAKISTVYACSYFGFYLPYATSAEMPYPMYIASTCNQARRWSAVTFLAGSCFDPVATGSSYPYNASAYTRHFDGSWQPFANYYESSGARSELNVNLIYPWDRDYFIGPDRNGNYPLFPAIMNSSYSGGNTYGELQGVYNVSGYNNAAENTITVAGKTYLVTQNMQRTARREYAALLLE